MTAATRAATAARVARPVLVGALVAGLVVGCGDGGDGDAATSPAATGDGTATATTDAPTTPDGNGATDDGATDDGATGDGVFAAGAPEWADVPDGAAPGTPEDLVTGLDVPWDVEFLPDGSALLSHRDSYVISRITTDGATTQLTQLDASGGGGEGGLLGLALPPDVTADPHLYAYYTTGDDNRIVRLPFEGTADDLALGEQEVLLTGIPRAQIHDGGALEFGPDGMLWAGTGDAGRPELAQDRDSLGGKVLRLTPDGDVPGDNPIDGSPVYSYGHRNVQGLAFDDDGTLWAAEFGANAYDEVNRIEAGANYGWPAFEGPDATGSFGDLVPDGDEPRAPAAFFRTSEASPSGIAYGGGSLWLAALRGERLWRLPVDGESLGEAEPLFAGDYGRLRNAAVSPEGELWFWTNNTDGRGSPRDGDDRILVAPLD